VSIFSKIFGLFRSKKSIAVFSSQGIFYPTIGLTELETIGGAGGIPVKFTKDSDGRVVEIVLTDGSPCFDTNGKEIVGVGVCVNPKHRPIAKKGIKDG
jgi:hypothetical protein